MNKVKSWLESVGVEGELEIASTDASARSYYRLRESIHSSIVMDASKQKESVEPFIEMTHRLREAGVRVPKIFVANPQEGFLLLEDIGDTHLLQKLEDNTFEGFYEKAMDSIIKIQQADIEELPLYNTEFLRSEMELMQEWYLEKYLNKAIDDGEKKVIADTIEKVIEVVLSQPQGFFVHRDFHSRNLMLTPQDEIVVIDYQDARVGAVTYDLVSLLRDCYISFDPVKIEKLALFFRDKKGLDTDDETFMRWFDFMGLQRHIKVLGIFARLHLRDGKDGYLDDIPQTLKYVKDVSAKHEEMKPLMKLFEKLGV
ncbi:MAG: phosphotransferase [Campylobacterota bacterium]|nr:phosphotransferase [Campylobacterota bacterium]